MPHFDPSVPVLDKFIKLVGAEIEQLRAPMNAEEHCCSSRVALTASRQTPPPSPPSWAGRTRGWARSCCGIACRSRTRRLCPPGLSCSPGSHCLYLRFGFRDFVHRDIDLNAWDGSRLRRFGVYVAVSMPWYGGCERYRAGASSVTVTRSATSIG
ncbi:hypothetical protein F4780DRAFT_573444 [Xylariomycetidae sp. FL0641]|nr:hypothetical protein F4780DRAFT_573444 [Xylariomycetidae sp. FL0641]